jgi:coenzyme PQQ synthesis protein D (PqqD)
METLRGFSPEARREGLLVRELADELVVYDLERHRAHSLNRAAALIWRHCDGRTAVTELAELLHRELDAARAETVVWMALRRLAKAHLLLDQVTVPAQAVSCCSRRELMRGMALVGGLAFVSSVLVPSPVQAQSGCLPLDAMCISSAQCCSNCCRITGGGPVCKSGAGACL